MVVLYHTIAVEDCHEDFLKLEASTQQICSFIPTGPSRSEVHTVNAIGLVDDAVKQMQPTATEHPVSNATLVILNNNTELCAPMAPSPKLRKAIRNCRDTVTSKFLA